MSEYIGLIRKEAESDFGVSFPDFPGVATSGKSLDEVGLWLRKPWRFTLRGWWRGRGCCSGAEQS